MNRKTYPFDPDYVVTPGETLREWMNNNGFRQPEAPAMACGRMPVEIFKGILAGTQRINDPIAQGLQLGTGIPAFLWLNLERVYRKGLAAGKKAL